MTVRELCQHLLLMDGDMPVLHSSPVQGDSENVTEAQRRDFYVDQRIPALVIFS